MSSSQTVRSDPRDTLLAVRPSYSIACLDGGRLTLLRHPATTYDVSTPGIAVTRAATSAHAAGSGSG